MKQICVYGSSSAALDKNYFDEAFALGKLLAQKGYGLVFGAGNMGLMGAAARGARIILRRWSVLSRLSPSTGRALRRIFCGRILLLFSVG